MKIQVSVVLPCYNEAQNIPELVYRITQVFVRKELSGEIILVNDGSTDNSHEVIADTANKYPHLKPIHHAENRGIAAAWRTGVKAAQGKFVCLMDADLQNLPEDVWRLYREIVYTGSDLVQGYRSLVGRQRDSRYIFSVTFNWLLNTFFGMHQRDNKSGFVIAEKTVLEDVLRHRFHYYYFQSFITVSAAAKGYSIREIETIFDQRLLGKSFMSAFPLLVTLRACIDFSKAYVEFRVSPRRDTLIADYLAEHKPAKLDPPLTGWRKLWFDLFFAAMPMHKWLITAQAKFYYEELKQSQYLTVHEVREIQELKLRRLIEHAYRHVGYWRELMDAINLKPEDIATINDLPKLPLLSKQFVKENLYFDMLSDNHQKSKILRIATSGSTAEPFICFADQHQLEIRWATTQRAQEWTGYRFGDRCARLWHQTIGMNLAQMTRERIDAWFCRRIFLPAFEMSDDNINDFARRIAKHKPVLIDGYAESFNFLAHYVRKHGLKGMRPKALMSSAQSLPAESREVIEKEFACRVFDKYGSREFSGIAYECEAHAGHHVMAESYIVEIIKDGKPANPGEIGEVVITDLNNLCMPLIRYRVGDLATAMDSEVTCRCGRGLPMIGDIQGRTQAIIFGINGCYMPGSFFLHVLKDYAHMLSQYQIVQENLGSMTLKVVKAKRFDEAAFAKVLTLLKQFLGDNMVIEIEFVENIPLGRTGKRQIIVSKIPVDFQNLDSALPPLERESTKHIDGEPDQVVPQKRVE